MSLYIHQLALDGSRPIGTCNYCGCLNDSHPICGACGVLLEGRRDLALDIARDAEFADGPFCKFCQRGDLDNPPCHCDWVGPKEVQVRTELAQIGDIWITEQRKWRGRIVEIENLDPAGKVVTQEEAASGRKAGWWYSRRLWVKIPNHPKPYPYMKINGNSFTTERDLPCNAPVCELHVREVGEDRHWCVDHWRAWETAA